MYCSSLESTTCVCDVTRTDMQSVWTYREVLRLQQKNCRAEAAAQKRGNLYSSERANPICWPLAMPGAASVQFHCEQHTRTRQAHRGLVINERAHRRRPGLVGEEDAPTWGHFFIFLANYLRKNRKCFLVYYPGHTLSSSHSCCTPCFDFFEIQLRNFQYYKDYAIEFYTWKIKSKNQHQKVTKNKNLN